MEGKVESGGTSVVGIQRLLIRQNGADGERRKMLERARDGLEMFHQRACQSINALPISGVQILRRSFQDGANLGKGKW